MNQPQATCTAERCSVSARRDPEDTAPSVTASQPQEGEQARVHHGQLLRAVKFTETESRMVGARAGRGENGELLFNGDGAPVWEDEKF